MSSAPKSLGNVVPIGAAESIPQGSPPSSYAAYAVVNGERGALLRFVGLTLLRGLIIAPGMALAGVKGKQLLLGAAAASGLISSSALVYCWYGYRASNPKAVAPLPQPLPTNPPATQPAAAPPPIDVSGEEVMGVGGNLSGSPA